MNIVLETETPVEPDDDTPGWWVDQNRLTVRGKDCLTVWSLPRGCRRITISRLGDGRSQLVLGGFKASTVTVTGPTGAITQLREAVL